jgi:hypothetical protein
MINTSFDEIKLNVFVLAEQEAIIRKKSYLFSDYLLENIITRSAKIMSLTMFRPSIHNTYVLLLFF